MQAKLRINEPGDPYEQEADRVAEQVMRMPHTEATRPRSDAASPIVQRRATSGGAGVMEAPPIVHDVLNSSGQPLDEATRAFFEPRFGHDFSRVRIHSNAHAEAAAFAIQAEAFTSGQHIVLGRPWAISDATHRSQTLAHELVHVVQTSTPNVPRGHVLDAAPSSKSQSYDVEQGGPIRMPLQRVASGTLMRKPMVIGPSLTAPRVPSIEPLKQGAASLKASLARTYHDVKKGIYKSAIEGLHKARKGAIGGLKAATDAGLSDPTKSLMLSFIDGVDVVFEFLIQIPLYILGMAAGFGEGIYALIEGLITLIYGIIKWFVLLVMGFVDNGKQFDKYNAEIIAGINAIPAGIRQVWADWVVRFEKASPDETSILIGELVGQILAIIASFGLAASKVGQVPKLTVPVGGLGVMRGGVAVAETVTIDFASKAKTVAALAEIGINSARLGDGGGGTPPASSGGATQDPAPKQPAKDPDPHSASPEAKLGLSAKQMKGLKDLLAKRLDEAPVDLGAKWTNATNAQELKIVKANTNMSQGARAQIRGYFNNQRNRFWRVVLKKGSPSAEHFKSLGFKWGEPGTAPYLELSDGTKIKLDIDHIIEIRESTGTALDAHNLRLSPARENRTVLRLLHDLDPFQKQP
ncbi:MAG: DUF4157 domain-containing protein [Nitrospiraceae bacterium]